MADETCSDKTLGKNRIRAGVTHIYIDQSDDRIISGYAYWFLLTWYLSCERGVSEV